MKYDFQVEDVFQLAAFLGVEAVEDGDEIQFEFCPYCHGGDHKDKNTFAINAANGKFNCLRATCGKRGHFVTLARDMGYALDFGIEEKVYRQLPQVQITVRPNAVQYLGRRGIGEEVVNRYKITTKINDSAVLAFPFYSPEGELVSVKYRNTKHQKGQGSKEWFERDTQPILFGMQAANDYTQPLVITEGQIDALSLVQIGVPNVVSVPNGCTSFTWVAPCFDWVHKFPYIIVMGDCEKGKITLVSRVSKSFKLPTYYIPPQSYFGLKDANEILMEYGEDVLLDAFLSAEEYIIPHIKRLADVEQIDFSVTPRILTGIRKLDETFGGMYYGQVVLLTGKRGEGKSTFMSQLILEAIDQGNVVLAYSGELTAGHFKNWMDFQAAGANGVINCGTDERPIYRVKPDVQRRINDWYRPYALIYDNESTYEDDLEPLLETIEDTIVRYGVNMVCIDNLMTAMDVSASDDFYRAQSSFVHELKKLAVIYNVVVLLVAHPRKELSGRLNNDSVSGSGDITNRVDSVLIYGRDTNSTDDFSRSTLRLTKNRVNGKYIIDNPIRLIYSESSKRITPIDEYDQRHYGWEKYHDWVEDAKSARQMQIPIF